MNIFRDKYNALIEFRKNNPPEEGSYIEKHHIIPRSIRPDLIKDPENIVVLKCSEHLKAHYLLMNMYREEGDKQNYRKMQFAFQLMKKTLLKNIILNEDELQCIAEIYENVRKDLSKKSKQ